jgi:acetyl esterase/lipase
MDRQQQRDTLIAALAAAPPASGTVTEERQSFDAFALARALDPDVTTEETTLGGRPAVRLRVGPSAPGTTDSPASGTTDPPASLLYLHGGGYVVGSGRTGTQLATALARRTGATAYSLDYRLAPEHPFPAAVDDVLAAYRELLETVPAERLTVAGDSAGGGLVVALLVAARVGGLPQPAAAAVFSPWVDLTLTGRSMVTRDGIDPLFDLAGLRWYADKYVSAEQAKEASPIFSDLSGIAPLLVQVGAVEVLLDDAVRLATRAAADDVQVTLEVGAGLPHVYQLAHGALADADDALDRAASFLTRPR